MLQYAEDFDGDVSAVSEVVRVQLLSQKEVINAEVVLQQRQAGDKGL